MSDLDLRDWFAGQALIACADHEYGNDWGKAGTEYPDRVARRAFSIADAMMAERAKEPTK